MYKLGLFLTSFSTKLCRPGPRVSVGRYVRRPDPAAALSLVVSLRGILC